MFDFRTPQQKDADKASVMAILNHLAITPDTEEGLKAAFIAPDSGLLLVGLGISSSDKGAKHLVLEKHGEEANSSRPGESNFRVQFRLTGEHYSTSDPTFLGFAHFNTASYKPILDAMVSGRLKRFPIDELTLFDRSLC